MLRRVLPILFAIFLISCKKDTENLKNPSIEASANLKETFKTLAKKQQWQAAEQIAKKQLEISEKSTSEQDLAEALYNVGLAKNKQEKYTEALEYFLRAYALEKKFIDKVEYNQILGDLLNKIANIYYINYQHNKALSNYLAALTYFEKTNNIKNIVACYRNIGSCYEIKKEYVKSLKNYKIALENAKKSSEIGLVGKLFQDLGDISIKTLNYNEAIEDYKKALQIQEKFDNKLSRGIVYNNLGNVYRLQNNYSEAKNYLEKALSLQSEDPEIEATAKRNLGYVYLQEKNYNTAEGYLLKSEILAKEADLKEDLLESYKYLSTLYKATNNYQKVALYTEKYAALNSELLQAEKLGLETSFSQINQAETKATSFISSYATTPATAPLPYLIGLAALIIVVVNMLYFYAKKSKKATHLASSLATQTHHTVEVEKNASQMIQEYTRKFQEFEQTGISLKNNLSEKDEKIMLLMQEKTSLEKSKLDLEEGLNALTSRIKILEIKALQAEKIQQEKEILMQQLAKTEAEYDTALHYMKQENDKLLYYMQQIEKDINKNT